MNRAVDELRYDISDPRNPLNMRKRGADTSRKGLLYFMLRAGKNDHGNVREIGHRCRHQA